MASFNHGSHKTGVILKLMPWKDFVFALDLIVSLVMLQLKVVHVYVRIQQDEVFDFSLARETKRSEYIYVRKKEKDIKGKEEKNKSRPDSRDIMLHFPLP